jgi:acetyl esterase/lipase
VITSTRDQLMSQSALFHRALLHAGVDADLILFEALPHAFWSYMALPETDEAFDHMARFFVRRMGAG